MSMKYPISSQERNGGQNDEKREAYKMMLFPAS